MATGTIQKPKSKLTGVLIYSGSASTGDKTLTQPLSNFSLITVVTYGYGAYGNFTCSVDEFKTRTGSARYFTGVVDPSSSSTNGFRIAVRYVSDTVINVTDKNDASQNIQIWGIG